MKQTTLRKAALLLLSAVLCCSALTLAACSENSSDIPDDTVSKYTPFVPENKIDASVPGETYYAAIGETFNYNDKVTVTLDRVVEIDDVDKTQNRALCAELTITNNSDSTIDCSTLTHFSGMVNGEEDIAIVRSISVAVAARRYYTAINSDLMPLNQPIEPQETAKGYVYIGAPSAWESLSLIYIPYKYYSNDCIIFDIDESKLTHYSNPL